MEGVAVLYLQREIGKRGEDVKREMAEDRKDRGMSKNILHWDRIPRKIGRLVLSLYS